MYARIRVKTERNPYFTGSFFFISFINIFFSRVAARAYHTFHMHTLDVLCVCMASLFFLIPFSDVHSLNLIHKMRSIEITLSAYNRKRSDGQQQQQQQQHK